MQQVGVAGNCQPYSYHAHVRCLPQCRAVVCCSASSIIRVSCSSSSVRACVCLATIRQPCNELMSIFIYAQCHYTGVGRKFNTRRSGISRGYRCTRTGAISSVCWETALAGGTKHMPGHRGRNQHAKQMSNPPHVALGNQQVVYSLLLSTRSVNVTMMARMQNDGTCDDLGIYDVPPPDRHSGQGPPRSGQCKGFSSGLSGHDSKYKCDRHDILSPLVTNEISLLIWGHIPSLIPPTRAF